MTWKHVAIIVAGLLAVISCGLHAGCVIVLPSIVSLVTFITGGVFGDVRSSEAKPVRALKVAKDAPDVTSH